MINRNVTPFILSDLFKRKVIMLIGPRQVGKTTLANQLLTEIGKQYMWLNCDEADVKEQLTNTTSTKLKALIGSNDVIVIDEAQRVPNIGITLKLMVENLPDKQVIVTGSSALELNSSINEPLTGRKFDYTLLPISYSEMVMHTSKLEEQRMLEHRLIYGYYPEVILNAGNERRLLTLITDSYLYKDLFTIEGIKKHSLFEKLIKALALQMGSEVSFHELGRTLGVNSETIEKYIYLLEQAFVVFRLNAFSRNARNELTKSKKIYFYDNGLRNALIDNFNILSMRTDTGALWENFLISERLKYIKYNRLNYSTYFWRTIQQQEIDYIEEHDGKLFAFEFKWSNAQKARIPLTLRNAYPQSEGKIIDRKNYSEFIGIL